MKQDGITIDIDAKITVSDKSVERCLWLLEIWQEDNPDKFIEGREVETETGRKILYRICEKNYE